MSLGAGRPGIWAVVTTRSDFGNELGENLLLFRRCLGVDFLRVAAFVHLLRRCLDELGSEALDLFLRFRPNVVGVHDGAEAAECGDRLEAGDPNTEDEGSCRRNRSSRGDEHRGEFRRFGCSKHHGRVTGNVGLGGQGVHRLGERGPWNGLNGERGDVAISQRLNDIGCHERVEEAGEDRTFRDQHDLVKGRPLDPENQVGVVGGCAVRNDRGACIRVGVVGEAGGISCTGLYLHIPSPAGEDFDGGGNGGNAAFVRGSFERDSKSHRAGR